MNLKSQKGSILVVAIVALALVGVVSLILVEQTKSTHVLTKKARLRSAMDLSEAKVKTILQEPLSYSYCDTTTRICTLDYSLLDKIDPTGTVAVFPNSTKTITQTNVPNISALMPGAFNLNYLYFINFGGGPFGMITFTRQFILTAPNPAFWCEEVNGTLVKKPLGYNKSDGTFSGLIFPIGSQPNNLRNLLNSISDCTISGLKRSIANTLGDNFVRPRFFTFQVSPAVVKVPDWLCDDANPVFRGFDELGRARCEPFHLSACPPGQYATGIDDNTLKYTCAYMNSQINCPTGQFIDSFAWNGGSTNSPADMGGASVNCWNRQDLVNPYRPTVTFR